MGPAAPMLAISAATGLLKAGSQVAQGAAASKTSKEQSMLYERNAQLSDMNAKYIEGQSKLETNRLRQDISRFLGTQSANQSKSGLTGVTAGDVAFESAYNAEVDALGKEYQGVVNKYNADQKTDEYRYAAKTTKRQGGQSMGQSVVNAFGSILGTAGDIYSTKLKFSNMAA